MKRIILCADTLSEKETALLCRYADSVVPMPRWDKIPGGIGYHPDMLGFARGGKLWLNREYYTANARLFDCLGADIRLCDERYGKYPDDVRFNAFAIGDTLFGKAGSLCADIKLDFGSVRDLKQGYAKCSAAVFGRSVITADRGIAVAVGDFGGDVLLVEPGSVALEGYGYGFIGGAFVCVSDDTLVSFGDVAAHPQGKEIVRFVNDRGFSIVSSRAGGLYDHGGLLVIDV